jgi:hypothetical protein
MKTATLARKSVRKSGKLATAQAQFRLARDQFIKAVETYEAVRPLYEALELRGDITNEEWEAIVDPFADAECQVLNAILALDSSCPEWAELPRHHSGAWKPCAVQYKGKTYVATQEELASTRVEEGSEDIPMALSVVQPEAIVDLDAVV